jgi:cysteine desulfurase
MKSIYLDNAATTAIAPEVFEAMVPYLRDHYGNPSSTHHLGRQTKAVIETSRRVIAKVLNCLPSEIYFTSGGTEADNLAMHAAVKDLGCRHIITTAIEHSAIIKTAEILRDQGKIELHLLKLNENGNISLSELEALLAHNENCYVTLMHGNNEIANLLPIQEVAEICKKYNAIFHSDTVQTMGHYAFDLQKTPISMLNAAAHKFHGPKGTGFIYIHRSIKIQPHITGGGQERGLRGGTENIAGIVGLAKAIELAYSHLSEHQVHIQNLKQYMRSNLQMLFPSIVFNGCSASEDSLYTVLNVTFPPHENADMFLFLLDLKGICASGGSACSSGATKGSHVLSAIDALQPGQASVRFSFSRYTSQRDVDEALKIIKEIMN